MSEHRLLDSADDSAKPLKDSPSFLTKREVGHEEAREAVQRLINSHFRQEPHARCGIPARPDYDDDLIAIAYIRQRQAAAEMQAEMLKALMLVDADAKHHLRSDRTDHSLLRADALGEVRRVIAKALGIANGASQ